jgi:hypothetical protein
VNWSPEALDRLERAIEEGSRVRLRRRGGELVVVPRGLRHDYGGERLLAVHPGSGEPVEVPLDEIQALAVLD